MNSRIAMALVLTSCVALSSAQFGDIFDGMSDRLSGGMDQFEELIQNSGIPRNPVEDFRKRFGDASRQLTDFADCFEPELDGQQMDIFDWSNFNMTNLAKAFYKAFPENNATGESTKNLFNSVNTMLENCLDPSKKTSAKLGFTPFSDASDEDMQKLMGALPGSESAPEEASRQKRASGGDSQCQVDTESSLPSSFDWRDTDKVTHVKNQRSCGSCWAFATLASIESGYLIKTGKTASDFNLDLSEQRMVNCAKEAAGEEHGCQGAKVVTSFGYQLKSGYIEEQYVPYQASENTCSSSVTDKSMITDYCLRSKYYYNGSVKPETLSDDTIMRALVQKGPLYFTINATPLYRNLRGGVLDDPNCGVKISATHAVLLVGYDDSDNSFIIKNSWGTNWGDKGYFKVVRGKNMCGINSEIAWPILKW